MYLMDYVVNGQGHGQVGDALSACRFDTGLMRPYIDKHGERRVTINVGRRNGKPEYASRTLGEMMAQGIYSPVFNATTLRKDEWIELDKVVLKAARLRLRAWQDLASANSYGGFNGMAKSILEHETMSDPGEALVDMDGMSEGRTDTPRYQLEGLPLPITHSDFWFSSRKLAESRNTGTPLDTTMAEASARRVAETIEQTLIGTVTGLTYGNASDYSRNPTVYGYTNAPFRNTKTDLTTPTGSNPEAIMQDVLEMREQLFGDRFFGPYVLYTSTSYDQWLDNDYFRTGGSAAHQTLRQRIEAIDGITAVRRLDYLTSGYQMILVQMTPDVARAINGMDITTVQWESMGGMRLNFKVMCIMVPQLRADFEGRSGIVHGTTA